MAIYFVQHGEALPKDVDSERSLSETGIENSRKVAEHLAALDLNIDRVVHSGKKRALQTAEIFAGELGNCDIIESKGMGPKDDVASFAKELTDSTMYVGHLPHLGKLISLLLNGKETPNILSVTNSGVICLDKYESGYQLLWHLPAFIIP